MRGNRARRACAWTLLAVLLLAGTGCAARKQRKAAEQARLSASAMFERATELLNKHDLRQSQEMLKRIDFTPDSRAELEPLRRLASADATYYQGTAIAWIEARNLYLDFVTFNGDHPLAPYAQMQVGLCSLKQVNQPTKDQALTRQAIRDLGAVEQRWPDSHYIDAARSLAREARATLAESEFLVGKFYLNKKNYAGAIERFRGIVVRFADYPEVEKVLYHLAQSHVRSGNQAEARIYLDRLVTAHPNSEYAARARKTLASSAVRLEASATSRNSPAP